MGIGRRTFLTITASVPLVGLAPTGKSASASPAETAHLGWQPLSRSLLDRAAHCCGAVYGHAQRPKEQSPGSLEPKVSSAHLL